MSRRSTRIAEKAGKIASENNEISLDSSVPSAAKRKRLNPEQKDEKQQPENKIKIKEEDNEALRYVKIEHQLPGGKVTKEKKYVGVHVSISGGLHLAVERALDIGAESFAMFLRSQRQWTAKPLNPKDAAIFQTTCKNLGFSPAVILPHGIYLMNCGSPDPETLRKSREVLVDELKRCEMLGLIMYNFHPGSTCGKISVEECLDLIAESINLAHQQTKYVVTVLENMSCQGNTVGGKFEELKGIIDRVDDKSRVGVCLDTCHAFAAGYDIRTKEKFEQMMNDFEHIIGLEYLKGVHLNDSKGDLGCHLDRHENIGKGKIGKKGFQFLMKDKRFNNIPLVLETPCQSDHTYTREIALLYSMK